MKRSSAHLIGILGLVVLLTLSGSIAYGEVIYSAPCTGGGDITMDLGSYMPETGYFSLTINLNNCVEPEGTFNGTMLSQGVILILSETEAALDYYTSINLTQTVPEGDLPLNCYTEIAGDYDIPTQIFTGDNSIYCSGSAKPDLVEVLSGLVIYPLH